MRANQIIDLSFEDSTVRVVWDEKFRPMWVVSDLGEALGLQNATRSVRRFKESERSIQTIETSGGEQNVLCVNEPGLYRLIFNSRKPEAEKFKDFVFGEVIPSLHKHGCYPPPSEDHEIIDQPHRPNHFDAVAAHCYRLGDLSLQYANNNTEHEARQNKIVQESVNLERELGIHLPLECDSNGKARHWDSFNPVIAMGHIPTANANRLN